MLPPWSASLRVLSLCIHTVVSHHIATDDADPGDAHHEGEDVVLLVLGSRAVRDGEAERHHKGQAEDEQESLHPPLRPRKPVVLRTADRSPFSAEGRVPLSCFIFYRHHAR